MDTLLWLINNSKPFVRKGPTGEILARYVYAGPVHVWRVNRMVELAMQGSNLCWMLQAAEDSDEPGQHLL